MWVEVFLPVNVRDTFAMIIRVIYISALLSSVWSAPPALLHRTIDTGSRSALLACARAVLDALPPGSTLTAPGSQRLPTLLQWLHERGNRPLFAALPPRETDPQMLHARPGLLHHIDAVVLQLASTDSITTLDAYLQRATNSSLWMPRANFIILVTRSSSPDGSVALVQNVAKMFWDVSVVSFLVTVPEFNSSENVDLYTWYPFKQSGMCGKNISSVRQIGKWVGGKDGYLIRRRRLFPQKVPKKLNNCSLVASTFKLKPFTFPKADHKDDTDRFTYGIEINLLQTIAQVSGYFVTYTVPPPNHSQLGRWGGQLRNGTWIGILGNLINKEADVAFAGFRMNEEYTTRLQFTPSYIKDTYVWLVQNPRKIPQWQSLTRIFKLETWLSVAMAYLLSVLVYWNLSKKEGSYSKDTGFSTSALKIWSVLLNISLEKFPATDKSRIFFFLLTFFSLLISVCYQSNFVGFLTNPGYLPQIRTVQELIKSSFQYGSVPYLRDLYDDDDPISKVIYKNFFACDTLDACFDRMVFEGKFSLLTTIRYAEYEAMRKFLDAKGKILFMKLDDDVLNFDSPMYMRIGSPYMKRFEEIINRVRESALINKWWNDIKLKSKTENLMKRKLIDDGEARPINLHHLQGAFGFLSLGLLISIGILIIEINVAFVRKK